MMNTLKRGKMSILNDLTTQEQLNALTGKLGMIDDIAVNSSGTFIFIATQSDLITYPIDAGSGEIGNDSSARQAITGSGFHLLSSRAFDNVIFLGGTGSLTSYLVGGNGACTTVYQEKYTDQNYNVSMCLRSRFGPEVLYVSNSTSDPGRSTSLYAYKVESNGQLTKLGTKISEPVNSGYALDISADGKFLFISVTPNPSTANPLIYAYQLDASTGAIQPGAIAKTVAGEFDGVGINVLKVNPATGDLHVGLDSGHVRCYRFYPTAPIGMNFVRVGAEHGPSGGGAIADIGFLPNCGVFPGIMYITSSNGYFSLLLMDVERRYLEYGSVQLAFMLGRIAMANNRIYLASRSTTQFNTQGGVSVYSLANPTIVQTETDPPGPNTTFAITSTGFSDGYFDDSSIAVFKDSQSTTMLYPQNSGIFSTTGTVALNLPLTETAVTSLSGPYTLRGSKIKRYGEPMGYWSTFCGAPSAFFNVAAPVVKTPVYGFFEVQLSAGFDTAGYQWEGGFKVRSSIGIALTTNATFDTANNLMTDSAALSAPTQGTLTAWVSSLQTPGHAIQFDSENSVPFDFDPINFPEPRIGFDSVVFAASVSEPVPTSGYAIGFEGQFVTESGNQPFSNNCNMDSNRTSWELTQPNLNSKSGEQRSMTVDVTAFLAQPGANKKVVSKKYTLAYTPPFSLQIQQLTDTVTMLTANVSSRMNAQAYKNAEGNFSFKVYWNYIGTKTRNEGQTIPVTADGSTLTGHVDTEIFQAEDTYWLQIAYVAPGSEVVYGEWQQYMMGQLD
jgi:hypothetical protein